MSAPHTDIDTQTGQHWASLAAIGLSLVAGAAIGVAITLTAVSRDDAPPAVPASEPPASRMPASDGQSGTLPPRN